MSAERKPDSARYWLDKRTAASGDAAQRGPDRDRRVQCEQAHYAAEFAVKGVVIAHGTDFDTTHDIGALLDTSRAAGENIPHEVEESAALSTYAGSGRYDFDNRPGTRRRERRGTPGSAGAESQSRRMGRQTDSQPSCRARHPNDRRALLRRYEKSASAPRPGGRPRLRPPSSSRNSSIHPHRPHRSSHVLTVCRLFSRLVINRGITESCGSRRETDDVSFRVHNPRHPGWQRRGAETPPMLPVPENRNEDNPTVPDEPTTRWLLRGSAARTTRRRRNRQHWTPWLASGRGGC